MLKITDFLQTPKSSDKNKFWIFGLKIKRPQIKSLHTHVKISQNNIIYY